MLGSARPSARVIDPAAKLPVESRATRVLGTSAGVPVPPPLAAIVSVFPLGVMVTLAPADRETASSKPLRLLTTCPLAMPAPVIEPGATLLAVAAAAEFSE